MRSLATKYRPQTFDEVVGHGTIVKILSAQINNNCICNTLLFAGKSGTGKTSIARLFAKTLNNGEGQPIEIDAASNSGVDNVRDIIKDAQERAVDCDYKVFIIDEAQSLSSAAWQAFLKCIEEPPKYTIFIFCTTDPQKIPATILNRVQRFNFSGIPSNLIFDRLKRVCELEGFTNYEESIEYISKLVNGCMREALTLLDKCADFSNDLSMNNTIKILGVPSQTTLFDLTDRCLAQDEKAILEIIEKIYNEGNDLRVFIDLFLSFLIDVQMWNVFQDIKVTKFPTSRIEDLKYITDFENSSNYYHYLIDKVFEIKNNIKNDSDIKATLDVEFMQIARGM